MGVASGRDSGVRRVAAGRTVGGEPRGLRVSPVRIYRRERHGRHARDEGCPRGGAGRRGGRGIQRVGAGRSAAVGGAEGPDEREKRGERARRVEAKRASRLGLGVAAAAAEGGTKRREGERVVARRGARRRRERAAGGSIHPSAAFFSPCAARTALGAAPLARSCRLRPLAISLLCRGSRDRFRREKRLMTPSRIRFFIFCLLCLLAVPLSSMGRRDY